ncbi:hypothetical protein JB92DRAFT_2834424 [Gautieria morchelliformis]|nr:hypothetical protein JB92DRAFT_2834424 [Gautieria morchelliformis]
MDTGAYTEKHAVMMERTSRKMRNHFCSHSYGGCESIRSPIRPPETRPYDRHGEEGLTQHEGGQHPNPFDMFSSFFGGGGPQQQEVCRGPMMTSDFEVNLEDMYKGVEIDIGSKHRLCFMINKKVLCDHFRGSGGLAHPDVFHVLVPHMQHYTLNVPVGIAKGSKFVFEGEGDESPDSEAGDVAIRVLGRKNKGVTWALKNCQERSIGGVAEKPKSRRPEAFEEYVTWDLFVSPFDAGTRRNCVTENILRTWNNCRPASEVQIIEEETPYEKKKNYQGY